MDDKRDPCWPSKLPATNYELFIINEVTVYVMPTKQNSLTLTQVCGK